jgi:hypothetical protein
MISFLALSKLELAGLGDMGGYLRCGLCGETGIGLRSWQFHMTGNTWAAAGYLDVSFCRALP